MKISERVSRTYLNNKRNRGETFLSFFLFFALNLGPSRPEPRLTFRLDLNIYPAAIVLMPLHHHLKFLVDLRVFGLGARGKIVLDRIGFRALWRHGTLMFLLVERLQVSADRFT